MAKIEDQITSDYISHYTNLVRQMVNDPNFELDELAKNAIRKAIAKQKSEATKEISFLDEISLNGIPGLAQQLET